MDIINIDAKLDGPNIEHKELVKETKKNFSQINLFSSEYVADEVLQ